MARIVLERVRSKNYTVSLPWGSSSPPKQSTRPSQVSHSPQNFHLFHCLPLKVRSSRRHCTTVLLSAFVNNAVLFMSGLTAPRSSRDSHCSRDLAWTSCRDPSTFGSNPIRFRGGTHSEIPAGLSRI